MLRDLGGFILPKYDNFSYGMFSIGTFKPKFCDKAFPYNPPKEIQKTNARLAVILRQLHLPRISDFLFDKGVREFCIDNFYCFWSI